MPHSAFNYAAFRTRDAAFRTRDAAFRRLDVLPDLARIGLMSKVMGLRVALV